MLESRPMTTLSSNVRQFRQPRTPRPLQRIQGPAEASPRCLTQPLRHYGPQSINQKVRHIPLALLLLPPALVLPATEGSVQAPGARFVSMTMFVAERASASGGRAPALLCR